LAREGRGGGGKKKEGGGAVPSTYPNLDYQAIFERREKKKRSVLTVGEKKERRRTELGVFSLCFLLRPPAGRLGYAGGGGEKRKGRGKKSKLIPSRSFPGPAGVAGGKERKEDPERQSNTIREGEEGEENASESTLLF